MAVKAITSFIKNHEKDNQTIMLFRDCLPALLKVNSASWTLKCHASKFLNVSTLSFQQNVQESVNENTDNEELQKCLIEIAEIAPKFLKSILDQVFEFCINVI